MPPAVKGSALALPEKEKAVEISLNGLHHCRR
jgi:hypothetical protein